jgi:Domain of unknown function (DUF4911)
MATTLDSLTACGACQRLDECTLQLTLAVPVEKIVLFQSFFELYPGIALVRTLDEAAGILTIILPDSMLPDCIQLLDSLRSRIAWVPSAQTSL